MRSTSLVLLATACAAIPAPPAAGPTPPGSETTPGPGAAAGTAVAAPAAAAASGAPGAPAQAAAAAARDGVCSFHEEGEALHEVEAFVRHLTIVVVAGRVTEATDVSGSHATGMVETSFTGSGPRVEDGQWLELTLSPKDPSHVPRKLRLRVTGDTFALEDGARGSCEWSAPAPAASGPAARSASPPGTAPAVAPSVESPEQGHAMVRVGGVVIDCTAHRAAHAALTECRLQGTASSATVAWGMSDDEDRLMCTGGAPEYQWEHGGGWNAGEHAKLGPDGARVRLADGVEAWFSRRIDAVELTAPGGSVRLDVDLDASSITPRAGAGSAHPAAKLLVDLTQPGTARCDAG